MVVQTSLRVPKELYEVIKKEAERKGISVNGLLLQLLWKWAER